MSSSSQHKLYVPTIYLTIYFFRLYTLGVDCVAIDFSVLFFLQLCYLHICTPPPTLSSCPAWDRLWHHLTFLWRCFGCAGIRNLDPNFCPGQDLNLGPGSLMAANVTTKLLLYTYYGAT